MSAPISAIILAQNEAANIAAAVDSVVGWASPVYVVDSFSEDATPQIAASHGARVVRHRFEHWATQRNWALEHLPLSTGWVLFLDADERVPEPCRREIEQTVARVGHDVAGLRVRFDYRFLGRSIRRSFDSHAVVRIVRRARASWSAKGAREYCSVDGNVQDIRSLIVHDDNKGLSQWIEKQNRNAAREALAMLREDAADAPANDPPAERKVRAWLRRRVYRRMPLFIRPFAYFVYRYVFRRGFLEGRAGLVYAVLHGFWYHFLVDALYWELKRSARSTRTASRAIPAARKDRALHDALASG